ncbi:MAG TPA: type II secretion system protein [Roseiarcus sp.]
MCQPANPDRRGTAGFTLIEALAALAVMGAGLAAIGPLASSSLHAGLYAERHLAEIETARKIMAGMPSREALPVGRLKGALDAHDWRIDSTLIGAPALVGDALWTPQRIEVLVRSPSGAMLKIDTIRLRRQSTKK